MNRHCLFPLGGNTAAAREGKKLIAKAVMKSQEEKIGTTYDAISPPHYMQGKIEVIDFIEDHKLGFHLGNVVKYICRSPYKGTQIQDLKKARWYLDRFIAALESTNAAED